MENRRVVEWPVEEGDVVSEGDFIAIVESEKTQADVESQEEGVFGAALIAANDDVEPGDTIGVVLGPDEGVSKYVEDLDVPDSKSLSASEVDGTNAGDDTGGSAKAAVSATDSASAAEVKFPPRCTKARRREGRGFRDGRRNRPTGGVHSRQCRGRSRDAIHVTIDRSFDASVLQTAAEAAKKQGG